MSFFREIFEKLEFSAKTSFTCLECRSDLFTPGGFRLAFDSIDT